MEQSPGFLVCDNVFGFEPGQHVALQLGQGQIRLVARVHAEEAATLLDMESGNALDLRGRLLLPGLVDAHVHAIASGMLMLSTMVDSATSLEQVEAAVRLEAARGSNAVRIGGLDMSRIPRDEVARIDRSLLDSWVGDRMLFVKSIEGHSAWFNTAAWEMIGISDRIAQSGVEGGVAEEMHRTGRVHGSTYESLTTPMYDSYSAEERRAGLELVMAAARAAGLTGLHCLEGYGDYRRRDFELLLELDGSAGVELVLYCRDANPDLAHQLGVTRFGGCWCLDGAIGAHSAAVSQPYADRPDWLGELYFSDEQISSWLESGLQLGMQPCVHAIGDRALAQAVRVLDGLSGRFDLRQLRPRVDHFVMGDEALAEAAAGLGITSAMQPAFDARWGGADGGYATRLGAERALQTNPVGTVFRAGLPIAGSSDSYITPLDPLGGIRAAMHHHNPDHRLNFDEAVALFTTGAAHLCHGEGRTGRIAPGFRADLSIIDGDRSLEGARPAGTLSRGTYYPAAGQ